MIDLHVLSDAIFLGLGNLELKMVAMFMRCALEVPSQNKLQMYGGQTTRASSPIIRNIGHIYTYDTC